MKEVRRRFRRQGLSGRRCRFGHEATLVDFNAITRAKCETSTNRARAPRESKPRQQQDVADADERGRARGCRVPGHEIAQEEEDVRSDSEVAEPPQVSGPCDEDGDDEAASHQPGASGEVSHDEHRDPGEWKGNADDRPDPPPRRNQRPGARKATAARTRTATSSVLKTRNGSPGSVPIPALIWNRTMSHVLRSSPGRPTSNATIPINRIAATTSEASAPARVSARRCVSSVAPSPAVSASR